MAAIKVKQVAHVCFFAHDVEASAGWYERVLGLPIKFKFSRKGEYFGFYLDAGGRTNIECFHKDDSEYSARNAITHFCLEVESIDDAVAHIRAAGEEVTDKKFGVDDTWQAWVTDPNGVRIELFEYTEKSAQFVGGDREANW